VVRVVAGSFYGTGVLLFNGQAVFTAAHLFASESTPTSVVFETNYGTQTVSSKKVLINPEYKTAKTAHQRLGLGLADR
jgi:hypothetical protein